MDKLYKHCEAGKGTRLTNAACWLWSYKLYGFMFSILEVAKLDPQASPITLHYIQGALAAISRTKAFRVELRRIHENGYEMGAALQAVETKFPEIKDIVRRGRAKLNERGGGGKGVVSVENW